MAAALAWAAPAEAGDGSFPDSLSASYATGDSPEPVAVGDFNNDGRQDIVAGNFTPAASSLTVRLGDGVGGFATEAPGSPVAAGGQPSGIAVGDFNSDGDEDLAVANTFANGNLKILIGNGTGAFSPMSTYNPNSGMSRVAVGDFNGDGIDDLVVAGFFTNKVYVRTGNGLGAFSDPATEISVSNPTAVAVGNFNGDSFEDFAVTELNGGLHVRLSNGNGTFSTPTGSPFAAGTQPYSMAVGDFNGDADDDLAIVGSNSTDLTIEVGNGSGGFTPHVAGPALPAAPSFVSVGDFNGDYNDDLAVSGTSSGTSIRLGDGTGEFPTQPPGSPYAGGLETAVGDFDADGVEDLAVTDTEHDAIVVRRGNGPSPNADNLLVNGNAETDPAAAARTPTAHSDVPGWINLAAHVAYVRYSTYGGPTYGGFPRSLASARWNGGENLIAGGPGGTTDESLRQGANVASYAAGIDAGRATVDFSADLGGYLSDNDHVDASVSFLDANGQFIGDSVPLPSVTAAERGNRTVLIHRAVTLPVPVGTRLIGVILNQVHATGAYQNGYADNVRVAVHVAPEPPPGGGGGDITPPQTSIVKEPDSHTEKAKVTYKFTSSEPNSTFECRLDDGKFRGCNSGKRKYKHLDFGKHRFQVRATDGAGNTDPTPAKDKFKRKH